jgi:Immunity protein 70
MGVHLAVVKNGAVIAAVETQTEDDFMYFRDSISIALEGNDFGGRFPVFQRKFFNDWEAGEIAALEQELSKMHAVMRGLPPMPADGNWKSKLARSERKPETMAEVFIDKDGAPLVAGLLALARLARENGVGIRWS